MKATLLCTFFIVLSGCAVIPGLDRSETPVEDLADGAGTIRPMPRPDGAAIPTAGARTAEDFDTTTAEERAAATDSAPPAGGLLGTTIVSLGNPAEPGFWLKTPLVSQPGRGKVVLAGKTVEVDLIPTGDAPGAGSRMSLAALRLLGASLTDLPEVQVFAG